MSAEANIIERRDGQTWVVSVELHELEVVQDLDYLQNAEITHHWFRQKIKDANPTRFHPDGHGLMVVDFDQKWIGHTQGYFDPTEFHPLTLLMSKDEGKDNDPSPRQLFRKAFEAGGISGFSYYDRTLRDFLLKPLTEGVQINEHLERLDSVEKTLAWAANQTEYSPLSFKYAPPGWTIERFKIRESHVEGDLNLFKTLLERGFEVNEAADDWKRFVSTQHCAQEVLDKVIQAFDEVLAFRARDALEDVLPTTNRSAPKKTI